MLKAFLLIAMQFVSSHSDLPMAEKPMMIVSDDVGTLCNVPSAYACQYENIIVMPTTCTRVLTVECKSALIHEMTHYLRQMSGVELPCNEAWEKEAYGMENTFLAQYGLSLYDFGYTKVQLKMLTTCPTKPEYMR